MFRNFPVSETTLTEEDIASCSRAFRKPKNAEEERKLIENGTPKSTIPLKKWNGRMAGKQKSSTRTLRIHNWQVLSASLDTAIANNTVVSLNFWLIKLVKEQSLIFCNSKFTACVILKKH